MPRSSAPKSPTGSGEAVTEVELIDASDTEQLYCQLSEAPAAGQISADVVARCLPKGVDLSEFPLRQPHSPGFFDPHNHLTGLCHWWGLGLAMPVVRPLAHKTLAHPAVAGAIAEAESRVRTGAVTLDYEPLPADEHDGYIYEFLTRGKVLDQFWPEAAKGVLDELREAVVQAILDVLADPATQLDVKQYIERTRRQQPPLPRGFWVRFFEGMFCAGPSMDFDTAYVAREIMERRSDDSKRRIFRYGLYQVIMNHLRYIEMSSPYWMPMPMPRPDTCAQWVAPDQRAAFVAEQRTLWSVLFSDYARRHCTIVMLPMVLSTVLAVHTLDDSNSLCMHMGSQGRELRPSGNFGWGGAPGASTPHSMAWLSELLDQPIVRGIDFASPESGCYNDHTAYALLRERLLCVFAKARQHNKRMVFHIHAGEGFPVLASHAWAEPVASAERCVWKAQTALKVLPDNGEEPWHYTNARNNIDALIGCFTHLRQSSDFDGLDDYVRIRLGHATHCTFKQALRLAELRIDADVNLGSNISTQSLLWERASDMPYDTQSTAPLLGAKIMFGTSFEGAFSVTRHFHSALPSQSRDDPGVLDSGASEWHDVVALVFRAHGVLPLLLAGVRVTVGTDSEGVEHTNMKGEYMTIAAVIAGYRACTAAVSLEGIPTYAARYVSHSRALKAEHEAACSVSAVPVPEVDLSVQLLFQYQHEHLSWMEQRPADYSST